MPTVLQVKDGNETQISRVDLLNWSKHRVALSVDNFITTTPGFICHTDAALCWERQMNYSVFETGVQSIHAIEDCAMTNAAMEDKCSGSLVWVECCRRSGSIVV